MSELSPVLSDSSPGSRVWKVGFSGEPDPRACFFAPDFSERTRASEVWDLDLSETAGAHGNAAEARRLVQVRIQRRLRDTFHKYATGRLS